MDQGTIYVKTAQGEEAVRQRTRLVQRNLRNILIMVDGYATVEELGKRFGNPAVVQRALAELAEEGFIWAAEKALADSIGLPTVPNAAMALAETTASVPADGQHAPARLEPQLASPATPTKEWIIVGEPEYESLPPPEYQARAQGPDASAPASNLTLIARAKAIVSDALRRRPDQRNAGREAGPERVTIKRIRRGPRIRGSWLRFSLGGFLGLVAAALLVLVLFPYEHYRPEIEKQAARVFGDAVRIGTVDVSLLPQPTVMLHDVQVGRDRYLSVAALRLTPDLLSLFGDQSVFREAEAEGVAARSQGLERLAQAGAARDCARAQVRHVTLKDLRLELADVAWEGIGGEVAMGSCGMEKIVLHNADNSFKFELQPAGKDYHVAVHGSTWIMPFKPGLMLELLEAQGKLSASGLNFDRIDARAYGGLIDGKGAIAWSSGELLAGEFDLKHLDAARLLPALSDMKAEGELSGHVRLGAKAAGLARLAEAMQADARLQVKHGALKGFDLIEAVRAAGRSPTRGGATRFEELSGNMRLEGQAWRLSNLRVNSGLMKAGGQISAGKDKRLNGNLFVELKGTATAVKATVAVLGTTREPGLMPAKGEVRR